MSIGDVAMFASLAGSVLGLDPDGQRTAVLQFLLVSFAPFVVLAPLIGPTIDRIPGGRRVVIQGTAVVRAALYVMMAFHTDDVVLYPLLFIALVIGWVVYVQATRRSLGLAGAVLVAAICGGIVWLLTSYRIVAMQGAAIAHIILVSVAVLLTIGMSWSHLSRKLTGQIDTDTVE